MNVTEVRALIALSNKNKRAIRAEAALQLREVDSRLQDSLLRWGQKEFTPETIWDTGVLRKFMPYAQLEDVSNLHGGKPVTLPLTKHLQEVIVKVAQTYVADAHFAYHYLYGGSSIILTDSFGAEEFLTRLSTYPKVRVPFASMRFTTVKEALEFIVAQDK